MLIPWLTVFDIGTVRANFIKPLDLSQVHRKSADFALLVPIFNSTKFLTNVDFLARYGKHVILCTTTNETEEFKTELEALSREHGFRVSYSEVGSGKKNPWAIYNKTLLAHDAVLKESITTLTEKYVIFIDGDTYVDGDLEVLCGAMDQENYDIASVKVLPSKRETPIEHLQGVEYDIAMQARLIYPWLTSGAGMVAKRDIMIAIMRNHSLFFNGGDIEIGKLADLMGYKVGHIPMVFYTDVPSTVGKWIKQRFSWMCGCFRHAVVNMHHNLNYPFHFIYFSFIIYFLYPLKVFDMMSHWYNLPLLICLYVVITYIANWKVRSKWMALFPFYALFQVLVIIWFGIYRYVSTVLKSENIGRIRVLHNPNKVSLWQPAYAWRKTKSMLSIVMMVGTISLVNIGFAQEAVFGRRYETEELLALAQDSLYPPELIEPEVAGVSTVYLPPAPTPYPFPDTISVVVEPGDGKGDLAHKMVEQYLDHTDEDLSSSQLAFVERNLQTQLPKVPNYAPGLKVQVDWELVEDNVEKAY